MIGLSVFVLRVGQEGQELQSKRRQTKFKSLFWVFCNFPFRYFRASSSRPRFPSEISLAFQYFLIQRTKLTDQGFHAFKAETLRIISLLQLGIRRKTPNYCCS